jgi:hypothetical protein
MMPRRQLRRQNRCASSSAMLRRRKVSPAAIILLYLLNIYSALAALPAPQELFVEALFAIDAHVIAIPDTTPGVDPAQSVAICGIVVECKPSVDGWSYRVRADDTRRNIIWVPKARMLRVEAAVFNFRKAQVISSRISYRQIIQMIHSLVCIYSSCLISIRDTCLVPSNFRMPVHL